jgi:hypothetical protein
MGEHSLLSSAQVQTSWKFASTPPHHRNLSVVRTHRVDFIQFVCSVTDHDFEDRKSPPPNGMISGTVAAIIILYSAVTLHNAKVTVSIPLNV